MYERGGISCPSYNFKLIHNDVADIRKAVGHMEFTVIISNPPYQVPDGGGGASAKPIYNKFIEQAKRLNPRFLTMIIPARWMTGGKGLNKFRADMISDKHITKMHDFINSKDCFAGVDIKGGVCYFLRERDRESKCEISTHNTDGIKVSNRYLKEDGVDVFIRQSELIDIKDKVWSDDTQQSFSDVVSVRKPYGFCTDLFAPTVQKVVNGKKVKVPVTAEEKYGLVTPSEEPFDDGYEIIGLIGNKRTYRYVDKNYAFPKSDGLGKWKIFIPNAYGCGALGEVPSTPVLGTPVLGTPVMACTETFLELGTWNTEEEASNALKYLKTKFFRSMISIMKQTQQTSVSTYQYVPMQDFTSNSDIDWTKSVDDISHQLYAKYGLSDEEIAFIEAMIKPME